MMYHTIYCINYEHPTRALYLSVYMPIYIYIDYHTLIRDLLVFASTRLVRKRVRNIDYVFQRPLCDDGGNEKY